MGSEMKHGMLNKALCFFATETELIHLVAATVEMFSYIKMFMTDINRQ
jgi:hypothetical protein